MCIKKYSGICKKFVKTSMPPDFSQSNVVVLAAVFATHPWYYLAISKVEICYNSSWGKCNACKEKEVMVPVPPLETKRLLISSFCIGE
jgi:hypothetical protein